MAKLVYIYKGLGASDVGCEQLYRALERHLSKQSYTVGYIHPEEITSGEKLSQTCLICFGGGFTTGFAKALGDRGIANLKAYVTGGGAYLGFGAGGYFGCDFIEFDVGGPLEKFSERDFRLYPGIGRGPVYSGFEYGTHKGVHAVPVSFTGPLFNGTFHAYIDGGGAFHPSNPPKPGSEVSKVIPIALYENLDQTPAAIVQTDVGTNGGKAILSGVHLEFDTLLTVRSDTNLASLEDSFETSKHGQTEAFKSLLILLGLHVI